METTWKVENVAEYLGFGRQTVYNKIRTGELPFYKIGRAVRFDPDEVRAWRESKRQGPAQIERGITPDSAGPGPDSNSGKGRPQSE
ncbi:MAG: hypothetical protein A3F83_05490 [Candidatus Glassbacteria bacterium RIFCSPLOWO2_12_FULL_58_11]|uniref:Helix-turn-helix domain-containing protein n=1 Tax=Candidatus Glassbacteria bacterium RIFCSPLOWO2_12_FULL_58_11 TaxID=1817867 RepID=A0A1F5YSF0_9BACT|nr:MAG: hypothetical protein A3F83_05490 [Candidatus Glassbacteria bacterium RIFCSPLOWO2_12_FULL_58_11]